MLISSRDEVSLDFCRNFAAAVSLADSARRVVGCGIQFVRISGFDFATQRSSLTVSNCRMMRRRRAALLGFGVNSHIGEACRVQLALDHCGLVIAMRRPRQKARWVAR